MIQLLRKCLYIFQLKVIPQSVKNLVITKCFKCFGRGHVQAQCPNQRVLFLKGKDEYTSGEEEPSTQEKGEGERINPLEGTY